MDILAAIFAYLGCVTGIVCALALSFMLYLSPHSQPANTAHAAAIATNTGAAKAPATTVAQAVPPPKTEPKTIASADTATTSAASAAAQTPAALSLSHRKALASRAQTYRRVVEEERARRWAYQQDPDFEARFLGYAD